MGSVRWDPQLLVVPDLGNPGTDRKVRIRGQGAAREIVRATGIVEPRIVVGHEQGGAPGRHVQDEYRLW
jgi:hypothetical protein